ncbi:hypothetical protein ACHQM5_006686 [Ranunculus cassubicifolius]
MQNPSPNSIAQPEAILEWLQKEMGYRPQTTPYISSNKSSASSPLPSIDSLRKICRGNMVPVWNFLLQRVKSEKTLICRHKQVMLEAYDQQSDEAARIFAEYQKRLHYYVIQARDSRRYYCWKEIYGQLSMTSYLFQNIGFLYKFENNRVTDASSPDASSQLQYSLYDHGEIGIAFPSKGTHNQLFERQKAHVQQFVATEDALNKAAEARKMCQTYIKKLHGNNDPVSSHSVRSGGTSQNIGTLRQFEANMDAAAFWNQQPLAAREYASGTIIPACKVVADMSNSAKDLIEKEISAFYRSPDNGLYMMPSTSQALLDSMGFKGSTGLEAIATAEKNAALLTARAGARDPSAIPSICRLEGLDPRLASVLESLEFCLKLRGSEANVLEDLSKAINLVHIRRDLVESGNTLLTHAYRVQQEYERGLVDEWWEQPSATVVDWVKVDGQNAAAWLNHVKQLQMAFYDKELL